METDNERKGSAAMTDIEQLLVEIEAGLEGVTPGPWKWAFKKLAEVPVGTLYGKDGDDVVCDFGDAAEYYPTEGTLPSERDQAHIARLSPDNVRAILDHIREIKRERDEALIGEAFCQKQWDLALDSYRLAVSERDRLRSERDEARAALNATRENISYVVSQFKGAEAAGYRSRDRQFAIALLSHPELYDPPENGDAITRARNEARAKALEEAAQKVDELTRAPGQRNAKDQWREQIGGELAAAIRALIPGQQAANPTPEEQA